MSDRPRRTRLLIGLAAFCCALGWAGVACAAEHDYTFAGDLAFWEIPTFILFILLIRKLGWGSFASGMDDREAKENRLIDEAEQARREAEELLRDHKGRMEAVDEEIRELIAEAHRDAGHTRTEIIEAARREAETLRKRALNEIARARDQSLDEIFDIVNERVIAATEERLATRLTADDQNRLVEQALAQFETTA
jgi:F-type H+-transporting ATPase subunit b